MVCHPFVNVSVSLTSNISRLGSGRAFTPAPQCCDMSRPSLHRAVQAASYVYPPPCPALAMTFPIGITGSFLQSDCFSLPRTSKLRTRTLERSYGAIPGPQQIPGTWILQGTEESAHIPPVFSMTVWCFTKATSPFSTRQLERFRYGDREKTGGQIDTCHSLRSTL